MLRLRIHSIALRAMFDYILFTIIGLIAAFSAIHRVHRATGSARVAALFGAGGFLFCIWAGGQLLAGVITLCPLFLLCSSPPARL